MEISEKTGKLLAVYSACKREGISVQDVVDILYGGYECFRAEENYAPMTKEWALGVLTTYEAGREKIPTDAAITEAAGGLYTVEEMKKWALKAVCHFYRCHSADQILLNLGLLEADDAGLKVTDICEFSVWEWFGGGMGG